METREMTAEERIRMIVLEVQALEETIEHYIKQLEAEREGKNDE